MSTSLILFNGIDASGNHGLWVTDGTAAGTSELSVAGAYLSGVNPSYLTAFGNKVLFRGQDANESSTAANNGHGTLWVTNGTAAGTSELSVAGARSTTFDPSYLTVFGSEVLFEGYDISGNHGLWVTNGTAAGTSELSVAGASSVGLAPSYFTVFGSEVLFEGFGNDGYNIWVTNGTAAGTSELAGVSDAYSGGLLSGIYPPYFAVLNGVALFSGYDASGKNGLWVTNGTAAGTSELSVTASSLGLQPMDLIAFGSEVLFHGYDANDRYGLWVTNGTAAGTSELSVAGLVFTSDSPDLTVFGSEVLFAGYPANGGPGLWVTNGTAAGTSEISVAGAYAGGLRPTNFAVLGSKVLFQGIDANNNRNLWVTDGTSSGTSELSVAGAAMALNPTDLVTLVSNQVTVTSGQTYTVASGQADTGDSIQSGATEIVLSGGTTSGATVSTGGTLNIASGGAASATIISGIVYVSGSSQAATIYAGGEQDVLSGGTVSSTTILAGGLSIIETGGSGDPTTIDAGGREIIKVGGSDTGVILNGGLLLVYGSAPNVQMTGGGTVIVKTGGSANGITLSSSGTTIVYSGGTVSGGTVSTGGTIIVASGAHVSGLTIGSGGTLIVASGATVSGVTVGSGGTAEFVGSSPAGVNVLSGGKAVQLGAGATALAYIYESGSTYYVNTPNLASPIAFVTPGSNGVGNVSVSTNTDGSFNVFWTSTTAFSTPAATYSAFEKSYSASGAVTSSATLISNIVAADGAAAGALTNYFDAATNSSTAFYAFENNGKFYVVGNGTGQIQFASSSGNTGIYGTPSIGNICVSPNADNSFQVFFTTSTAGSSAGTSVSYTATENSYAANGTLTSTRQIGSQYSFDAGGNPVAGNFFAAASNSSGGYVYAYRNGTTNYVASNTITTPIAFTTGTITGNVSVSLNSDGSFAVFWTVQSPTNQPDYTAYENTYSAAGALTNSTQQIGNYTLSGFAYTDTFAASATKASTTLFSAGVDDVNFNNLSAAQQQLITSNSQVMYTDFGGSGDQTTLPTAGKMTALSWSPTNVFYTGSLSGQNYSVIGSDGSYNIALGAGSDTVTINGNGNSAIVAGSGNDTISITGTGNNVVVGDLNSGTVTIAGRGELDIKGSFSGSATIGNGSRLELGGTASGSITFASGSGISTLDVDSPSTLSSVIKGFSPNDRIDLEDVPYDKTEASFFETTNNLLQIVQGKPGNTTTYSLQFDPSQSLSGAFQLSSDGIGGTLVTYAPQSTGYSTTASPGNSPTGTPLTPYHGVFLIQDDLPNALGLGASAFRGTGFAIGPHAILTAAHVVENLHGAATNVDVAPGFGANGFTVLSVQANPTFHNLGLPIFSQNDFAVITVAEDLTSYGLFGLSPNFAGGTVNVTGYPIVNSNDQATTQYNNFGWVTADGWPNILINGKNPNLLDVGTGGPSTLPGYSGGPLWTYNDSTVQAVGVVSTSLYAAQITPFDVALINSLEAAGWHTFYTAASGQSGLYVASGVVSASLLSTAITTTTVRIVLTMSEAVTVTGALALTLNDGGVATYDAAASKPSSGLLVFDYTVHSSDQTPNLAITNSNLSSSIQIQDANDNNASLSALYNLPTGLTINSLLRVNLISSSRTGEAAAGQTVHLTVNLNGGGSGNAPSSTQSPSGAVSATSNSGFTLNMSGGAPTLMLNDGATATYDAGLSNLSTGQLVFDYTVGTNDSTPNLAVSQVNLPTGTTIQDANGNNADFSAALNAGMGLQIGPVSVVGGATSQSEANTGQTVLLTLELDGSVNVNMTGGSPILTLSDGATATYDAAASSPSTGSLVFDYLVRSSDHASNVAATYSPNGAVITDNNGVNVVFSAVSNAAIGLTVNSPLTVASESASPASGRETSGTTIQFTLTMSETVSVATTNGIPTLALNNHGTAAYLSGDGTNVLTFSYTVARTDASVSALAVNAIKLNGGTVTDGSGNNADFSHALVTFPSLLISASAPNDFNGAGTSDILFRNTTSGDTWFETMSNGAFAGWNQIGGSNTTYSVAGVGDFYGTGTSDVLYRNDTSGDTWFEAISNGGFAGWNQIGGSDNHYSVVGVGDFYGTGTSDILFRNNSTGDTWFEAMSNGAFAGWHQVGGSDTHYSVVGVGDFYGSGTSDILFRNNSTGDTWFEAMSDGIFTGWHQVGGSDTRYAVVGVGDFYGNGTSDILYRNNSTGDMWFEAMSNGAFLGWHQVGGSDTRYAVVGTGDYFGTGTSDILFRNNSTGDIWYAAMSNGNFSSWHQVGGSDPSYSVKA
jgi:autotransporter passenger strand-loop-strand repeat protein/ELWxxDGT repeat protein